MENKNTTSPVRKDRVKSRIMKIITFFTCVVLVFVSIFAYSVHFDCGYKYYQTFDNSQILIGQTLNENFLDDIVIQERTRLEDIGYYIVSMRFNPDIKAEQSVVRKSDIDENTLTNNILKCFEIETLLTKLNIKGENRTLYFKTEEECKTFVSELNKISKVETTIEGTTGNYKLVSSQETLDKIKTAHQERADREAQAAIKAVAKPVVTSRSGSSLRQSNKKCKVLQSYVYISSEYGPRRGKTHTGVDFAANYGTQIYSWKSGTVTFAGWSGGYGNFIEVNHNDGTVSRYAHCSSLAVSVGQQVTTGQVIGYVGSTGNSTGNHLHLEIKVNGSFVNPLNYL